MSKLIPNKTGKTLELLVAITLILVGVGLRLLPHAPNFAPIAALALFSGVYLSKRLAFVLPLAAMLISDIFLGFYDLKLMAAVYGSFALVAVLGFWLKNHKKWQTILGSSALGGILFFLITNFAVWAFSPWYSKTFLGIVQCYTAALPFLRNTLLGDLFYAVLFFGIFELADIWIRRKFGIKETNGYTFDKSALA